MQTSRISRLPPLVLPLVIRVRHIAVQVNIEPSLLIHTFLSRVSILTRDIDIANLSVRLSVRYVTVPDANGLTYRHSFFTIQ